VHTDIGELLCDTEFLFACERDARCLFTISQGGIENCYSIVRMAIGEEDSTLMRTRLRQRLGVSYLVVGQYHI